jgi:hypothetical protein
MTTDSEAWEAWDRFGEALRKNEQHLTAGAALDVARWLRERQKRGDFGAPETACGEECPRRHPHPIGPSRLDAMEARKTVSEETISRLIWERDLAKAEAEFLQRQLEECEKTRNAAMRVRDEQRARAGAAEKRVAAAEEDEAKGYEAMCAAQREWEAAQKERDEARSLLKEALGHLKAAATPWGIAQDFLAKARAAGYAVEGETP